ncbi:MAG: ATP-binding cassette domain-containing protein, partial [Chloroflexi bacterium]|nr:ATP-binding cassette domain-containing protein [Chloroflexota bacterium]
MNELALQCQGLTKWYGDTEAIVELDLMVERGKTLVLLGPSGCGKTTFLRLIAGFETPDMGEIKVDGVTVAGKGI